MASEVLDEAYVRLHHWGPEFGGENGLSNHGPMAAEVLSRRGFDDQVGQSRFFFRFAQGHPRQVAVAVGMAAEL